MSRVLDGQRVSDIEYCLPCLEREARTADTDWNPADCPLYGTCPATTETEGTAQ